MLVQQTVHSNILYSDLPNIYEKTVIYGIIFLILSLITNITPYATVFVFLSFIFGRAENSIFERAVCCTPRILISSKKYNTVRCSNDSRRFHRLPTYVHRFFLWRKALSSLKLLIRSSCSAYQAVRLLYIVFIVLWGLVHLRLAFRLNLWQFCFRFKYTFPTRQGLNVVIDSIRLIWNRSSGSTLGMSERIGELQDQEVSGYN